VENTTHDQGEKHAFESERPKKYLDPETSEENKQLVSKRVFNKVHDWLDVLSDSDIQILNKSMKGISEFSQLIQISNQCIDGVIFQATLALDTLGSGQETAAVITCQSILEICKLRRRINDYSEGINSPILEKLNEFQQKFQETISKPIEEPSPVRKLTRRLSFRI